MTLSVNLFRGRAGSPMAAGNVVEFSLVHIPLAARRAEDCVTYSSMRTKLRKLLDKAKPRPSRRGQRTARPTFNSVFPNPYRKM